jgi:hypothetical protein
MDKFSKKEIKLLKGHLTGIARSVGCSRQYVDMVIKNPTGAETDKINSIVEKAKSLIKILSNE